jgi:hypothetical protein
MKLKKLSGSVTPEPPFLKGGKGKRRKREKFSWGFVLGPQRGGREGEMFLVPWQL